MAQCARCNARMSFLNGGYFDAKLDATICDACYAARSTTDQAEQQETAERRRQAIARIIVTSTHNVDGYYVARYIGFESVENVIGTGPFSEATTALADLIGGRSGAYENKLQVAKRQAMDALRALAVNQDADAILGVDLDYTEFSGNRVGLILSGTLVKLARRQPPRAQ